MDTNSQMLSVYALSYWRSKKKEHIMTITSINSITVLTSMYIIIHDNCRTEDVCVHVKSTNCLQGATRARAVNSNIFIYPHTRLVTIHSKLH